MAETQRRSARGRSYADTRSAVLDLIRTAGTTTRVELAQRSSLTEVTISKIVKDLIAEGVVAEAGVAESTGGKRPRLLRLSQSGRYALGITLDLRRVVVVLCSLTGEAVQVADLLGTADQEPDVVLDRIAGDVQRLLAEWDVRPESIIGVGLASGGRHATPLGSESRESDPWDRTPIDEILSARLGLPVIVENDARCAALGQFWGGGADATGDFLMVYMAYGIGAGLMVGGDVYRGSSGNAGEIGHVVAEAGGRPCWCGNRGCLETVAPPRGLIRDVREDAALAAAIGVAQDAVDDDVYAAVVEGCSGGVDAAVAAVDRSVGAIANVLVGLVNLFDLGRIFLAGPGFAALGEHYRDEIQARIDEVSVMRGIHDVRVTLASVSPRVAALGAASVVLHSTLTPHLLSSRS